MTRFACCVPVLAALVAAGLFENPSADTLALIQRINHESARFYNSPAATAFYNPVTCLEIISPAHEAAVKFSRAGDETVQGQRRSVLRFTATDVLPNPYARDGRPLRRLPPIRHVREDQEDAPSVHATSI